MSKLFNDLEVGSMISEAVESAEDNLRDKGIDAFIEVWRHEGLDEMYTDYSEVLKLFKDLLK